MGSGVMLGGFGGVMFGLHVVTMGQVGVMSGLFVIARFVVLGGGGVMLGSMLVVLRGVAMMIGVFLRHGKSSLSEIRSWDAFSAHQYIRVRLQADGE